MVPMVVGVEDEVGVPPQAVQGGRHGGGLAGVHNGRAPRRLPQQPHVVVLRACIRGGQLLEASILACAVQGGTWLAPSMPTIMMTYYTWRKSEHCAPCAVPHVLP